MVALVSFWLSLLAALAACALSAAGANAPQRPNILFLLADDLRADTPGYAGHRIVQTPHLDALAKRGTAFRNAFVTTSICCVSRASLFSGQYARRHGIEDFKTPFMAAQWSNTYPALLRAHGYRTGFIGKFGVGDVMPTNAFDYWDGFPGQGRYFANSNDTTHLTRDMGDSALKSSLRLSGTLLRETGAGVGSESGKLPPTALARGRLLP